MNILGIVTVSKDNLDELCQTLDSILKLSLNLVRTTIEVVVVDSSSTSNSSFLASQYDSLSLTYVWTQPDGIYSAMNLGLTKLPTVDFIWFLNSGCMAHSMCTTTLDSISILPFTIYCASVECNDKYLLKYRKIPPVHFNYLAPIQPVNHQGILYSADIFQDFMYSYNVKYIISGDFDLFLRLLINHVSITIIPCILTTGINEDGISSVKPLLRTCEYITLITQLLPIKPFLVFSYPFLFLDCITQFSKQVLLQHFPALLYKLTKFKRSLLRDIA